MGECGGGETCEITPLPCVRDTYTITHTYKHMYTCTHTHLCTQTHRNMQKRICTHTHTHTHAHSKKTDAHDKYS